jgi:hypothetical protein
MMREARWPARALGADYARALAGIGVCAALLGFGSASAALRVPAAAALALFLVYFARTVCRQFTRIVWDETGIRALGPLGATIRWAELRALRLAGYSTRADREGGWMQIVLRGVGRRAICIDSGLPGFEEIVRTAAAAARQRALALDRASAANLRALGFF